MADYQSSHSGPTIDTRVSQVATNTADIAALKSRMNSAEAEIDTKADSTTVTALSSQIGGVEAKIPSAATTSNKLADKAYVDASTSGKASQSDLTNLTNRVTVVEAKIPSNASSSNQLADKSFVNAGLASKQATLQSGTNIKTINGESILGSGNIVAGDPNAVKYVAQSLTDSQKAQARTNIGAASAGELTGQYYGFYTSSSQLPTGMSISGYAFVGQSSPFAIWNYNGSSWSDSGATVDAIEGEPGVGFASVSSQQDGTVVITLTNGDTITIDLNHNHTQYPKYVYLTSESQMPASPDSSTLYLIAEQSN